MITKQVTGDQFPPTTNGRLVHDSSDVSMNGMLCGTSRPAQGVPNGLMYSQEQGQALRPLGLSPQWLDVSVYGTPTARRQSSYPQGVSDDSANLLTIASFSQAQMPFSNFSSGDQEDFASKQGFQKRNSFAQVPPQVLYNGDIPGNFEQLNFARSNASVQEADGMHGGGQKTTRVGCSQGLVALDAMEKKILFSMDENILDASLGRCGNIGAGRFGNTLEHLDDHSNASSYSQSGSYSALLQSAVAEASSSDSDLQGWSGLTFQNTGLSNENQPSNFVENYTGQVSDSVMGLEKEELPGFQDNLMEVASRGNVGSNTYAAGGKLDSFSGCGLTTQTRQSREGSTFPHILSKVPKEQKSDASLPQADNQSYASQQCGLSLAPQSQQLPHSSHLDASQGVPKTEHQFPHSTLPGLVGRLPPFNLPLPRDASQPILGQQFPIWEALHTTQPSDMLQISRQTGSLVKPPDILTNILPSQQHLSADELQRGPSIDLSNNSLETSSLIQRELKDQNLRKDEYESSSGADFMNSKGYDYQEEKPAIGRSHHLALPETDTQTGNSIQRKESAASSLETHLHEQDFGKLHYSSHQDVHPLHQVHLNPEIIQTFMSSGQQAALSTGQSSFHQNTIRVENPMNSEMDTAERLNSYPSRDVRMESFLSVVRSDQTVHASSGPVLQRQSTNTQTASCQVESSQISVQMAPYWFPMHSSGIASIAMEQILLGKPSLNSHLRSCVEQMNASASHVDIACPSRVASLVERDHLPRPYILTSGVAGQTLSVMRPKKSKTMTPVLLPWHKEVKNGSQAFQNLSLAKQDWEQASYCLVERMEDGACVIEGGFPMVRPKRRLTMTTHLMQQLFQPSPPTILQADATSNHACVLYSVTKLVLGDSCSLACMRSDSDNSITSEKLKGNNNHVLSKAIEDFTFRGKKLENDLLRLDKTVPILDIRLECQEMEKCSLMNRFARFHGRVRADAAEAASSSCTALAARKRFIQRYVIALPAPKRLPLQMQCLSL